jgi:DNA polymerase-3 subunit epsilon
VKQPGLFYDTETGGLPLWNQPSEHPDQPHIVGLAGLLVDLDTGILVRSMDVIIRPDGWVISDEVAQIHGITQERAMDEGIPESDAVEQFLDMWGSSSERIGFNEPFDARILRIALKRLFPDRENLADLWKAAPAQCMKIAATKPCNLKPTPKMIAARRFHPKAPTLGEAYQHFFGKPLEGAHTAMGDTTATKEIYFALNPIPA